MYLEVTLGKEEMDLQSITASIALQKVLDSETKYFPDDNDRFWNETLGYTNPDSSSACFNRGGKRCLKIFDNRCRSKFSGLIWFEPILLFLGLVFHKVFQQNRVSSFLINHCSSAYLVGAEVAFRKAVALDPTNPRYNLNLGILLSRFGSEEEGKKFADKGRNIIKELLSKRPNGLTVMASYRSENWWVQ